MQVDSYFHFSQAPFGNDTVDSACRQCMQPCTHTVRVFDLYTGQTVGRSRTEISGEDK